MNFNNKNIIKYGAIGILTLIFVIWLCWYMTQPIKTIPSCATAERSFENRRAQYSIVSNRLASLSDKQLEELLKTATSLSVGYGENVTLNIEGIPVFIKKVPLTDLERKPENIHSTANLFNLPLFYQYGVGSAGFGAWRELAASVMTTNWVLTGQCENFPIMYHSRVLPGLMPQMSEAERTKNLDENVAYWDDSPAVRERLQAIQNASAFVVLFLEYIPKTLSAWLDEKFQEGPDAIDKAVAMIEKNLEATTSFMAAQGMYHFDAHFHNILTDGCRLYFADLGLALSSAFDLSAEEVAFLKLHKRFDQFFTRAMLARKLAKRLASSQEESKRILDEYANGKQDLIMTPTVTSALKKYTPNAVLLDTFFSQLGNVSKLTPYPAEAVEALYIGSIDAKER